VSREAGGRTRVRFAETPLLPTYLVAFVAGEFKVESGVRNGRTMRFFHRETDTEKGRITRLAFVQRDERGRGLLWNQRLKVAIGSAARPAMIDVLLTGSVTEVEAARARRYPPSSCPAQAGGVMAISCWTVPHQRNCCAPFVHCMKRRRAQRRRSGCARSRQSA
jgi:hypothetical protein